MRPLYDVDTGAMANRALQGMQQVSQTASGFDRERPGAPGKSAGGGIMAAAGGAGLASAMGVGASTGALGGPVGLAIGAGVGALAYYMS